MTARQIPESSTGYVELPKPRMNGGMPLMDALRERKSTRSFKPDPIPLQELSNILWAAGGYSRVNAGVGIFVDGCGTAPGAHNWQEIDVYVATAQGLHRYDPGSHQLRIIHDRDIRAFVAHPVQMFVLDAPISIIYVVDFNLMTHTDDWDRSVFPWANSAVRVENVYLYCASEGLATVCRALFDRPSLAKEMELPKHQMVTLHQPIGYAGALVGARV